MTQRTAEAAPRRGGPRWIPLLVFAVFVGVAVFYGVDLRTRAEVGSPAPDFVLTDMQGREVALADFRGRPVIVNFWATWCPSCRHETPAHQAFLDRYGDRVAYIAVNLREPEDKIRRHREEFARAGVPLGGRVELLDRTGKVFSLFRYTGTPETWVIDSEGRAVHHFIGASTFEELVSAVEAAGAPLWREPEVGWIRAVAPAPETGRRAVWLGTDKGVFEAVLDDETGFAGAPRALGGPVEQVRSLAADAAGGAVWAVGRRAGGEEGPRIVARGDAEGWSEHLAGADPLAVAAGSGGTVYVWTAGRGMVVSRDGGKTWQERVAPFRPETAGIALAVDPRDDEYLLGAGPGGVWRSRDGGRTWERTAVKVAVLDIAFDPDRAGRVYFAHEEGVLVSDDGGRSASAWRSGPQRHLSGLVAGAGWGGPAAFSPDGDLYVSGAAFDRPWTLYPVL